MSFFSRSFPALNRLKQLAFRPRGVEEFFENGKSIPTEKSWTGKDSSANNPCRNSRRHGEISWTLSIDAAKRRTFQLLHRENDKETTLKKALKRHPAVLACQ
jgi:hypothetical protein